MRNLLILLSVVLAVALCQSTKIPTRKLPVTHILPPFNCIFGIKKVNGTRKCKTKEEFFQNPRNDTNCSVFKELKCYTLKKATACICVRKHLNITVPSFHKCPIGEVWRCKRERHSNKLDCSCSKVGPVKLNNTSFPIKRCPGGFPPICPFIGPCRCH